MVCRKASLAAAHLYGRVMAEACFASAGVDRGQLLALEVIRVFWSLHLVLQSHYEVFNKVGCCYLALRMVLRCGECAICRLLWEWVCLERGAGECMARRREGGKVAYSLSELVMHSPQGESGCCHFGYAVPFNGCDGQCLHWTSAWSGMMC